MKRFAQLQTIAIVCGALVVAQLALAQGRQRISEKAGGFSYALPMGWKVREFPGLKYQIAYGAPSGNFAPNVNFVDEAYAGPLAEYVKLSKDNIIRAKLPYTFLSEKAFATDAVGQAVRLEADTVQQDQKLRQIFYFLEANTRKFVVTCSRLRTQPASVDADCDGLVKSFRLE